MDCTYPKYCVPKDRPGDPRYQRTSAGISKPCSAITCTEVRVLTRGVDVDSYRALNDNHVIVRLRHQNCTNLTCDCGEITSQKTGEIHAFTYLTLARVPSATRPGVARPSRRSDETRLPGGLALRVCSFGVLCPWRPAPDRSRSGNSCNLARQRRRTRSAEQFPKAPPWGSCSLHSPKRGVYRSGGSCSSTRVSTSCPTSKIVRFPGTSCSTSCPTGSSSSTTTA